MTPENAAGLLRAAIVRRPDLRFRERVSQRFRERVSHPDVTFPSPYTGFCYIATEAFCALVPEAVPYASETRTHFWSMVGDEVWDLTIDQFPDGYDHSGGRPTRFKLAYGMLSWRARELVAEAQAASPYGGSQRP